GIRRAGILPAEEALHSAVLHFLEDRLQRVPAVFVDDLSSGSSAALDSRLDRVRLRSGAVIRLAKRAADIVQREKRRRALHEVGHIRGGGLREEIAPAG